MLTVYSPTKVKKIAIPTCKINPWISIGLKGQLSKFNQALNTEAKKTKTKNQLCI